MDKTTTPTMARATAYVLIIVALLGGGAVGFAIGQAQQPECQFSRVHGWGCP